MSPTQEAQQANVDQAALWNGAAGNAWVETQSVLDEMLAPFERLLIEQGLHDGTRSVLDVGCGAGSTTLSAARHSAWTSPNASALSLPFACVAKNCSSA